MRYGMKKDGGGNWYCYEYEGRTPTAQEAADALADFTANQDAANAAEAARLAARPARSAINAAKSQIAAATTIAGLRTGLASLVQVLEDTLTFQQVDVDEDV